MASEHSAVGRRVRLVDVAQRAGVTKSVASRVLTGDPTLNVRADTRDRVLSAAAALGYRAHAGARALAGAEARAIALLVPDLDNPVYTRIIRGAYRRARTHGYVVLLAEDSEGDGDDEVFAELVESGRVDALLIASARPRHRLVSSGRLGSLPHVFLNRAVPDSGRNITMDMEAASALAVQHLHGLGHRHIGLVSGSLELSPAQARQNGFVAQMRSLRLKPSAIENAAFTEEGGATATHHLLERHPELTAIYASTLPQAIGVLHAALQREIAVPDELSVISYDDLPLAGFLTPPLTTVAMPLVELGAAAVDAVLDQLHGAPPRDIMVTTPPEVVIRHSTNSPAHPGVHVRESRRPPKEAPGMRDLPGK